jgi:N-methylhydantoinase B
MQAAYVTDCVKYPPRGTRGGGDAARNIPFRATADGVETEVAALGAEVIEPGGFIGQHHTGGGGYGHPFEREPERVRADVLAGFVSLERARDVYGVAFQSEEISAALAVDEETTAQLRHERRRASA